MKEEIPKVGDVVADKYRIDGVIGEGGMGVVLTATHRITGKRVALKWMHEELAKNEEAVQRFIREAQAAGRIDHPNVVDIYDVEHHGDTVFLVMEFLHGEPLTELLSDNRPEIADVVRLLLPALRGVAAAHKQGIVHRDIKPDNIFLCRSPEGKPREAKVLDFGISKVISNERQYNPRLTRTGALMGTPYYMSPEQVRGVKDIGPQADVYAFGVILYEALTGEVPFNAETFSALVLEIATGTPKPPSELRPDLPLDLEQVIARAMAKEPSDRYPDIESLARALEPFAGGATFESLIPATTSSHRKESVDQSLVATATPFTSEVPITQMPTQRSIKKGLSRAGVAGGLTLAVFVAAGFGAWKYMTPPQRPENTVRPAVSLPAAPSPSTALEPSEAKPLTQVSVEPERAENEASQAERDNEETAFGAAPTAAKQKAPTADADRADDSEKKPERIAEKRTSEKTARAKKRTRTKKITRRRTAPRKEKAPLSMQRSTAQSQTASPPTERPTRTVRGRTGGIAIDEF